VSLPRFIAELIDESLAQERSGDMGAAFQRARQALEKARTLAESEAFAAALTCLAKLQYRQGHYDVARALAEEALTHASPDAPTRADAWLILGLCAAETDLYLWSQYRIVSRYLQRRVVGRQGIKTGFVYGTMKPITRSYCPKE
jgi:tetratricopeptide (TPR) repeat protein